MIKLAADEDFNNRILRGLLRRQPQLDIIRVIEEILLLAEYSLEGEWEGQIRFLPLR